MKRPRQYQCFIEAYWEQSAVGKNWIAFLGLTRLLQRELTRLAAVCFSWNTRKQQRWWYGIALTRPLAFLVLPLPCHSTARVEEQQSAKSRGQGLLGLQGTFPLWSSRRLLFLPAKQKPLGDVAKSHPSCLGQHGGCLLYLLRVLCLVVWWWFPRAVSGPFALGPGGPGSLGSWEDHNSWLMLLCWTLFNVKIFPSWWFCLLKLSFSAS